MALTNIEVSDHDPVSLVFPPILICLWQHEVSEVSEHDRSISCFPSNADLPVADLGLMNLIDLQPWKLGS